MVNETLNSLDIFWSNPKFSNIMKFVQWEPSFSMRTNGRLDRRTYMTKPIVVFRNFAKALKNNCPYFYSRFIVKLVYWLCFGENSWRRLEWIGRFLVAMETPPRIIAKLVVIATNPSSRSRLRLWSNYYRKYFYTRTKGQHILCTLETWFQFL